MADFMLPLKTRSEIAEGTMAFVFDTSKVEFKFKAGQYSRFTLIEMQENDDAEGNSRLFSIASSPNRKGEIMIASRMRDTPFKNNLKTIPIVTEVKVSSPR